MLVLGSAPVAAQTARSATWERFDVTIDLLPDGTLRVVERQQVRFEGTFQRGFRDIPFQRLSSVTEVQLSEGGAAYRAGYNDPGTFSGSRQGDMLRIEWWFPPTTNATRTFELSYRVSGAVRVYEGGDQIWWKAVPSGLGGAVRASTVVVRLPAAVQADQLKAEAYLAGSPQAAASTGTNEIRFGATNISPGQEYEVRVQFPRGLVNATRPAWQEVEERDEALGTVLNLLSLILGGLILIGGPLAIYLRWYTGGRDPAMKPGSSPVTEPPSDLPPGLVGTLVDERVDVQDAVATLLDLGYRGVIRVTQLNAPASAAGVDYRLDLLDPGRLGLQNYERTLIHTLFHRNERIVLSKVKDRWRRGVRQFQDQIYAEAVHSGFFVADPHLVRRRWRAGGFAAILVGFGLLFGLQAALFGVSNLIGLPALGIIVCGVVGMAAASAMPRRTKSGASEAQRWRAFGRHLEGAKLDQGEQEGGPKDGSAGYLPYAVALGVERAWMDRFARAGGAPRSDEPVIVGPGGWYWSDGGVQSAAGGAPQGGPEFRVPDSGWLQGGQGLAGALNAAGDWVQGRTSNLDAGSGALSGLLNSASEALASGFSSGGSDGGGWGGGGDGGGWSGGGGGGGGSGGGGGGFD